MTQDADGTNQDASKASDQVEPDASGDEVAVFLKEDMDAVDRKWQSIRDREAANYQKSINLGVLAGLELEQTRTQISELEGRIDDLISQGEGGADLTALRKEVHDRKNKLDQKERELGYAFLAIEEEKDTASRVMRLLKASEIANTHGIDVNALIALNPQDEEQMESMAKTLAEQKAQLLAAAPKKPGSGLGDSTLVGIDSMSADEKLREGFKKLKK